jgi:hypothetical protein
MVSKEKNALLTGASIALSVFIFLSLVSVFVLVVGHSAVCNASFPKAVNLTGTSGALIAVMNITAQVGGNANFSDYWFMDTDGTTPLTSAIINKSDSTWAQFRVKTNNASYVYICFGNSSLERASNVRGLYTQAPDYLYTLDESAGTTITPAIGGSDWGITKANFVTSPIGLGNAYNTSLGTHILNKTADPTYSNFSLSYWLILYGAANGDQIGYMINEGGNGQGLLLELWNGNFNLTTKAGGSYQSGALGTYTNGALYHLTLAMDFSNKVMRAWINGTSVLNKTFTGAQTTTTNSFWLPRLYDPVAPNNLTIDEFTVWNTTVANTTTVLEAFYTRPISPSYANVSAYAGSTTITRLKNGEIVALDTPSMEILAISPTLSSFPCWANVVNDGGETNYSLGDKLNNTAFNFSLLSFLGAGWKNTTAICRTYDSPLTNTSDFSEWNNYETIIANAFYEAETYETKNASFGIIFYKTGTQNGTAVLEIDGTNYTANSVYAASPNATLYNSASVANVSVELPFIAANNTPINHKWYISKNPFGIVNSSSTYTQNLYFSAEPTAPYFSPLPAISGTNITAYTGVRLYYNGTVPRYLTITYNGTNYTGAYYGSNATYDLYQYNLTMPNLTSDNVTVTANSSLLLTSFGANYSRISGTTSLTAYRPGISLCGGIYSTYALNLTHYSEEAYTTPINATHAINISFLSGSYSGGYNATFSGSPYYQICVYPAIANFTINATSLYSNTGYSSRFYFIKNAAINNATNGNLSFYLLPEAYASNVTFTVQNNELENEAGLIVIFYRWFPGANLYLPVQQVETSGLGSDKASLRISDVYYRLVVKRGNTILLEREPWYGSLTPVLTYSEGSTSEYFSILGQITGRCSSSNVTGGSFGTITCLVTDSTGLSNNYYFDVWRIMPVYNTSVCSNSYTTPSAVFTCNLGNTTGKAYYWQLKAVINGNDYILETGNTMGAKTLPFGNTGPFITFFIVAILISMGGASISASLLYGLIGLVVSYSISLIGGNISAFIALAVVIVILIGRIGRGG